MRISIILFIFALLVSCKEVSPIIITPEFGETFELRVGNSVTMANSEVTILFNDVTDDSRCPTSVECVRAGEAKLNVQFNNSSIKLDTDTILEVEVESYIVKLIELEPYPEYAVEIPKTDYRASFIVTKTVE